MKYNLPCAVVQDLLPNYAESLTSEETSNAVGEHLSTCAECKNIYEAMAEATVTPSQSEQKEIDFLKKTRNRTRRVIIRVLGGAVCALLLFLFADSFLIGRSLEHVEVNNVLFRDDNTIEVSGMCDGEEGFQKLDVTEEDGRLCLRFIGTRESGIYQSYFTERYTAESPIREICIDDRIIWKDGVTISESAADLYATGHDYVGDMSANGKTADALNISSVLPGYLNELTTTEEPYGWVLTTRADLSEQSSELVSQNLQYRGYALLASIGNLSYVTYKYFYEGELTTLTVTEEDATAYAGEDIKAIGADIVKLEKFMRKTGLVYSDEILVMREAGFTIINNAEPLCEIRTMNYIGEEVYGGSGGYNADGSLIQVGEEFPVSVQMEMNSENREQSTENAYVQVAIVDSSGAEHMVEPRMSLIDLYNMKNQTFYLEKQNGSYTLTTQ